MKETLHEAAKRLCDGRVCDDCYCKDYWNDNVTCVIRLIARNDKADDAIEFLKQWKEVNPAPIEETIKRRIVAWAVMENVRNSDEMIGICPACSEFITWEKNHIPKIPHYCPRCGSRVENWGLEAGRLYIE